MFFSQKTNLLLGFKPGSMRCPLRHADRALIFVSVQRPDPHWAAGVSVLRAKSLRGRHRQKVLEQDHAGPQEVHRRVLRVEAQANLQVSLCWFSRCQLFFFRPLFGENIGNCLESIWCDFFLFPIFLHLNLLNYKKINHTTCLQIFDGLPGASVNSKNFDKNILSNNYPLWRISFLITRELHSPQADLNLAHPAARAIDR
jgi:hypothetical protein